MHTALATPRRNVTPDPDLITADGAAIYLPRFPAKVRPLGNPWQLLADPEAIELPAYVIAQVQS
jgi:hypothetical protein